MSPRRQVFERADKVLLFRRNISGELLELCRQFSHLAAPLGDALLCRG
ncbi:MAG: hypothetical protein H0X73_04655 [Chthoniobacterales bacterium]|nr:hypothetical protein [Chthoniobacterales bacterium]